MSLGSSSRIGAGMPLPQRKTFHDCFAFAARNQWTKQLPFIMYFTSCGFLLAIHLVADWFVNLHVPSAMKMLVFCPKNRQIFTPHRRFVGLMFCRSLMNPKEIRKSYFWQVFCYLQFCYVRLICLVDLAFFARN